MPILRTAALQARTTLTAPLRARRLKRLAANHAAPMSVLFYHRVADQSPNPWTISCREFERHVDFCRQNFELVDLAEVQRRVRLNRSPRPTVTFTFDDGYAENCRFALPLLIRHQIPTVYFVSIGHILHQRPFAHDVQAGKPLPVNTVEELKAAAEGGIEIGLHTRNHVDFSKLNDPVEVRREIVDAKQELEDHIGKPVRYFAIPFGLPQQITQMVVDATQQAGLSGYCSAFGAYNLPGRDATHIRRIHGDPEFARLRNWLSFDPSKLAKEPAVNAVWPAETEPLVPSPPREPAQPLKVQFLITSMPVGGAETLLVNLMRRMDASRFRPEVVCLKEPGPLGEQIADEFPVHCQLLSGKWDLRVLPRLVRLMRRCHTDAVVTVGAGDKMFWGRLAGRLAGVPVIASALHSTGWPDGVGRVNRGLTPITDAFIAVADSHGRFLRAFERFPAEKVHVIRNGVDCERFVPDDAARRSVRQELGLPESSQLIGIVAALRSEKNHGMLIRAAASLAQSGLDAHWLIVGDGPERESIEALARQLDVSDRIHLLGTRHDTPRLLASLDLFTLCSLNEASPVSILEALACGVPVVATDVGSINETVLAGKTGSLVASEDTAGFASAISRLLSDEETRRAMGRAGRDLVVRTGSLQSMVDGYQQLILEQFRAKTGKQAAAACVPEASAAESRPPLRPSAAGQ